MDRRIAKEAESVCVYLYIDAEVKILRFKRIQNELLEQNNNKKKKLIHYHLCSQYSNYRMLHYSNGERKSPSAKEIISRM